MMRMTINQFVSTDLFNQVACDDIYVSSLFSDLHD
jgi:hypothetical protein